MVICLCAIGIPIVCECMHVCVIDIKKGIFLYIDGMRMCMYICVRRTLYVCEYVYTIT